MITSDHLKLLTDAINKFPQRTGSFRTESQNTRRLNSHVRLREFFRKLTKKLAGESPDDQASFLIYQAQKLKGKAYVLQESLNTIPTPPDFETLDKKRRQSYNHIYSLIDKVLAKAAGSSSLKSQLKVLEARSQTTAIAIHNEF